jgi:hypothetical protein
MGLDPAGEVFIVQFPHPGREHNPKGANAMDWNAGKHARKFLRSPGRYVARAGSIDEGPLAFWGEWEPPSRVVDRWPTDGLKPRFLHEPYWTLPSRAGLANTDPWVFGERFRFSNCKQLTPQGAPSALQFLTPGSTILFGSQVDEKFALDTVFVVADRVPYSPVMASRLDVDDAFRACTLTPLTTDTKETIDVPHAQFSLFSGATYDDPIGEMFSFVPARLADGEDVRFARPPIHLSRYLNPKSKQAPSGARRPLAFGDVRSVWETVRQQVLDAGCVLGVQFPTPPPGDLAATTTRPTAR